MKRWSDWKQMWNGIWHGLSHNGRKELLSLLLQENRHLDAILVMMMRSDPQAVGAAPV